MGDLMPNCCLAIFFFFSSRRRHTRSLCDWSSDVCSSDLRVRLVLAGMLALVVLASGAALAALDGRDRAREEARTAEAQRLGAAAASEESLDRSLLLARQGVALNDTPVTRDNLLAALRRSPAAVGVMRGDGNAITSIDVHPDGHTVAVGDSDGSVIFLDARTRRRLAKRHEPVGSAEVTSIAFSPDGSRLASTGWHQEGGFVDLFDARTRRHLASLAPGDALWDIGGKVSFSPDSRVLVVQSQAAPDRPNRRLRFDARTGEQLGGIGEIGGRAAILLGFAGSRVVTTSQHDRETVVRDVETLGAIRTYPVS